MVITVALLSGLFEESIAVDREAITGHAAIEGRTTVNRHRARWRDDESESARLRFRARDAESSPLF